MMVPIWKTTMSARITRPMEAGEEAGIGAIEQLSKRLSSESESLNIADIRSIAHPFGVALKEDVKAGMLKDEFDKALQDYREKNGRAPGFIALGTKDSRLQKIPFIQEHRWG